MSSPQSGSRKLPCPMNFSFDVRLLSKPRRQGCSHGLHAPNHLASCPSPRRTSFACQAAVDVRRAVVIAFELFAPDNFAALVAVQTVVVPDEFTAATGADFNHDGTSSRVKKLWKSTSHMTHSAPNQLGIWNLELGINTASHSSFHISNFTLQFSRSCRTFQSLL